MSFTSDSAVVSMQPKSSYQLIYVSNRAEQIPVSQALDLFARGCYLYSLAGEPLVPFSMRDELGEDGDKEPWLVPSNDFDHPPFESDAANTGPFHVNHWKSAVDLAHARRAGDIQEHDEMAIDRLTEEQKKRERKEEIRARTFVGSLRYGKPPYLKTPLQSVQQQQHLVSRQQILHGGGQPGHFSGVMGPQLHGHSAPTGQFRPTSDAFSQVGCQQQQLYSPVPVIAQEFSGYSNGPQPDISPSPYPMLGMQPVQISHVAPVVGSGLGLQPYPSLQQPAQQLFQQPTQQLFQYSSRWPAQQTLLPQPATPATPAYSFGSTMMAAPVEARLNRLNPRRRKRSRQQNQVTAARNSQYGVTLGIQQGALGGASVMAVPYQYGMQHVKSTPGSGFVYQAGGQPQSSSQFAPLQNLGPVQRALSTEKNLKMEEQKLKEKRFY